MVIGTFGEFIRKDVSHYLEAYKAKMLMRDILEARRLTGFARVVMLSIHTDILMLQADNHNLKEFEGRLLGRYGLNDSLRMSKKDLMD